jgi:PPK2 family polyphosphate:nucleotide phosphotransferase
MHLTPKSAAALARPFTITDGRAFRLKDVDPGDTGAGSLEQHAANLLDDSVALISDAQETLYAAHQWAVLLIFQAMDAAGKDSAIKHVLTGVNPQGVEVFSFKQPSAEELDHDFLWRTNRCLPERGRIGVFNRSYYEETLVVRVHPEYLEAQHLPPSLISKNIWAERFEDINAMELHLARSGTVIRKFFLHVSREEQLRRFLKRLDRPEKNWKFSPSDVKEAERWDAYMRAYEDTIRHTATPHAPWIVAPADHKWFTRLIVASAIIEALTSLKLSFPRADARRRRELAAVRAAIGMLLKRTRR